jgi:hypothetical protein
MFLYLNIKHNSTCVRTESYNLHSGTRTSLYTPYLEYIFFINMPPPQDCWYYKTLEFQAVEGSGYKIIPHCKKSVELFLLMYSKRLFYLIADWITAKDIILWQWYVKEHFICIVLIFLLTLYCTCEPADLCCLMTLKTFHFKVFISSWFWSNSTLW